jgi:uncharacterized membrane protein
VNDPTTAGQVINHLEDMVVVIGRTPGLDGHWEYHDANGALRLVMPAHRFSDFLTLGFTEIREYGGSSTQIARRLRAALEALDASVLPEYRPAVAVELDRLQATVEAAFVGSPDAVHVHRPDRQGIGGPPGLGD